MQALQRLALALTLATVALLAPVAPAHATDQYAYWDQTDGRGVFIIETVERVSCSNMWTCQCWLVQNGWKYYGTGCVSETGTISCTFTHKIPQCGCGVLQGIRSFILVCRPGGDGCWHYVGEPQKYACCQLR